MIHTAEWISVCSGSLITVWAAWHRINEKPIATPKLLAKQWRRNSTVAFTPCLPACLSTCLSYRTGFSNCTSALNTSALYLFLSPPLDPTLFHSCLLTHRESCQSNEKCNLQEHAEFSSYMSSGQSPVDLLSFSDSLNKVNSYYSEEY